MAAGYRSITTGAMTGGGASGITLTKPAGTTDGDFLLTRVALHSGTATVNTLAGWTGFISIVYNTNMHEQLFWRIASSEPASYAWTFSTNARGVAEVVAFTGVNAIDTNNNTNTTATSTLVAPSLTALTANEMLVCFFSQADGAGAPFSQPTGMTEIADHTSGANKSHTAGSVNYQAITASGATGTRTSTSSSTEDSISTPVLLYTFTAQDNNLLTIMGAGH